MKLSIGALLGLVIVLSWAHASFAAAPVVVGTLPTNQALQAAETSSIEITFDQTINPLTLNAIRVFGRWSGVHRGSLQALDGNTRARFIPYQAFSAGEWVTVSMAKGLENMAGEPMATGYTWNFWVRSKPASIDLVETAQIPVRQTGELHIQCYGAYAGDLNEDGYSDLAVINEITADLRVFLNDGAGGYGPFTVVPIPNGNVPSANEGADFNGDGHIDLAIGNGGGSHVSVMLGDGNGGFLSTTAYTSGNQVRGIGIADLDGDGAEDIIAANRFSNNLGLFENAGNGVFLPVETVEATVNDEYACAVTDANGDGIADVFVGGNIGQEVVLMLGDGAGNLIPAGSVDANGRPWMMAAGDMNGDGHADVVSANSFANNIAVILGDGAGNLTLDDTYFSGAFTLAIDVGDIDGDGDLDVVASNFSSNDWYVWENDGTGTLVNPKVYDASAAGSCAILHDRDNDGDLDMTGVDELDDLLFMFENPGQATGTIPTVPAAQLFQNAPNPFNPSTRIDYQVFSPGNVSLRVFDLRGSHVRTLIDERTEVGRFSAQWDGTDTQGRIVASGVYVYELQTPRNTSSRRMVLLK